MCILEIHVHTDHFIGAGALKEAPGATTGVIGHCAANGFDRWLDNGVTIRFDDETVPVISTRGQPAGTTCHIRLNRLRGGPG